MNESLNMPDALKKFIPSISYLLIISFEIDAGFALSMLPIRLNSAL